MADACPICGAPDHACSFLHGKELVVGLAPLAEGHAMVDEGYWVADRAIHVTADGRAVEEDDPEGRFVLVGKGARLPIAEAERHGLVTPAAPTEPEAKARPKAANKAVAGPPENKGK